MFRCVSVALAAYALVACGKGGTENPAKPADAQKQAEAVPPRAKLTVTKVDAGTNITDLGYGIAVNKRSTLKRVCYNVNDPTGPARLKDVSIRTSYRDPGYRFLPKGEVVLSVDVRSTDMVILLFDVLGEHMHNLRSLDVGDVTAGTTVHVQEGSWYASENDVSEYLTCIAYVRSVRLADDTIWKADRDAVFAEIGKLVPDLKKEAIDPEKRTRDPKT